MSQYSKSQEYRIRDRFRKEGIEAERIPLSGACAAIGKGDVSVDGGKVLVDHKSTIGKEQITLHRRHLEKIRVDAEKGMGVVTFSFKSQTQVYVALALEDFINLYKCVRIDNTDTATHPISHDTDPEDDN